MTKSELQENHPVARGTIIGALVRAGLNTAPFTGGIASLWSEWDTSRRFARVEQSIKTLGETLQALGRQFDPSRLGEAEMQLLEQTLERLSREHREWKRRYFVNLLASNWVNVDRPFEERELFERALDTFDHVHFKILTYLSEAAKRKDEPIPANDLFDKLFPTPESDLKFGVFMPALNSLAAQFGFVRRKAIQSGKVMTGINPDGLNFMAACLIVPLGQRFIDSVNLVPHREG